jgi:tyrosine-protein kinase Etk/Wzc
MDQPAESYQYVKSGFRILRKHWFWFVLSVSAFTSLAFFLNWYLQPGYEVGSIVLMEEENPANKPDPSREFMKSFAIFSESNEIQMEILKLKSLSLVKTALAKIHAEISCFAEKGIRSRELYHSSPFQIRFDRRHVQTAGLKFSILPLSGSSFQIRTGKEEALVSLYNYEQEISVPLSAYSFSGVFRYGDTIRSPFFSFCVQCDPESLQYFPVETGFSFIFNDLQLMAYTYQKEIRIEQLSKDVHAASIKIKSRHVQKGIDFIDALTTAYQQQNMDKKNRLAGTTIEYLDKQLRVIEDSLNLTEHNLQQFRSTNKVMEIAPKSDLEFKSAADLEIQKEELQARSEYYHYIQSALEQDKEAGSLLVPSSMGVDDNVLTSLISDYIKAITERNNLIQDKQVRSPYFKTLGIKIESQRNTLKENVHHLIHTNNLLLASVGNRLKKKNKQITQLPATQREMVGIERKYKLNDNLYNYLLQKKAEAEVAKASTIQENDILETAHLLQPKPVFPDKSLNIGLGFLLGLLLPFAAFGLRDFMDQTVQNEHSVSALTPYPFLGRIYHRKGRKPASILVDAPKSALSESIRSVRTNVDHFLKGQNHQVVLITSTLPGEGKSFTALNLATSMALLGRKTILVSFDIRKPGTYPVLDQECQLGISSVLSGRAAMSEVVEQSSIPNLDIILSGPILPNPSELIGSPSTALLLEALKTGYEYVFIDTPPLGLVTDALLLMKYADLKIVVVREKQTLKSAFVRLMQELKNKEMNNLFWLINDVDASETFYGKKSQYFSQD